MLARIRRRSLCLILRVNEWIILLAASRKKNLWDLTSIYRVNFVEGHSTFACKVAVQNIETASLCLFERVLGAPLYMDVRQGHLFNKTYLIFSLIFILTQRLIII